MRVKPMFLAVGLGVLAAACGRDRNLDLAADSARVADSLELAQTGDSTAAAELAAKPAPKPVMRRENLVKVTEQAPGLLTQARFLPIDAQHLAQTKYPEGVVKSGTIDRRAGDLVYGFEIQQKGVEGTELVLVNALDGSIVNTIHRDAAVAQNTTTQRRIAMKTP